MSTSIGTTIHKWATRNPGNHGNDNLFCMGAKLYSYGTHWPLAQILDFGNGLVMAVINPDRYVLPNGKKSMTTARHASLAWRAAEAAGLNPCWCPPNYGPQDWSHIVTLWDLTRAMESHRLSVHAEELKKMQRSPKKQTPATIENPKSYRHD